MQVAHSGSELKSFFPVSVSYSKAEKVIVERYVDGQEYSVNAYVNKGHVEFSFITKRVSYDEYPGGIIKKHIYENIEYSWKEDLLNALSQIVNVFNISDGPVYVQFKVNSDDQIKIIEIAPRFDGCHLWRLINTIFGVNLLDVCFEQLLYGENVEQKEMKVATSTKYHLSFISSKPGIPAVYPNDIEPKAMYYEEYYNTGTVVSPTNGYMEKIGYWIGEYE